MSALAILAVLLLAAAEPNPEMNCPDPSWRGPDGPLDELPRRIKTVPPEYPSKWRRQGIETDVIVLGTVDLDGNFGDVVVHSCKATKHGKPILEDELTDVCRVASQVVGDTVRRWKYEPAKMGGKPVCSVYTVRMENKYH